MKRLLGTLATLFVAAGALWAQPVLTTTPFTRNMLKSNDAAGVRAHIGVTTTNAGIAYVGQNLGTTNSTRQPVFSNTVSGTHYFRMVEAGSNMAVSPGGSFLTLNANLHGTNLGTLGATNVYGQATNSLGMPQFGVYQDTHGKWHRYYTLQAGTNVVMYSTPTSIVVNASAAGGGGGATTLDGLTDVDTSGVANTDVLTYDGGTANWVPFTTGTFTNVVYLAKNGNDVNATRGVLKLPYASISNAVAALTNGDTLVIFPGDYLQPISTNWDALNIIGKSNVSILGIGMPRIVATNIDGTAGRGDLFHFESCVNLTVDGIELVGEPARPGTPGATCSIGIDYGTANKYLTIRNCRFLHWSRFGISSLDVLAATNQFVTVEGSYFYNIGSTNLGPEDPSWDGAAITITANDVQIRNNWFESCLRGVEPYVLGNQPMRNIDIVNNSFINIWGCAVIVLNTSTATNLMGFRIVNNTIQGAPAAYSWEKDSRGMQIQNCADLVIARNIIRDIKIASGDGAVAITSATNGSVNINFSGNMLKNITGAGAAMSIYGLRRMASSPLSGVTVSENTFSDIEKTGIEICANDVRVVNNIFQNIGSETPGGYNAVWLRAPWEQDGAEYSRGLATNITIANNSFWDRAAVTLGPAIRVGSTNLGGTNAFYNVDVWGNTAGKGMTLLDDDGSTGLVFGGPTNDVMLLSVRSTEPSASTWLTGYNTASNKHVRLAVSSLYSEVPTPVEGTNAANKAYVDSMVSTRGAHFYIYGSQTSAFAASINVTNAWVSHLTASSGAAASNSIGLTSNLYFAAFVSSNTYSTIAGGPVDVELWCFEDTAGSGNFHAEMYLFDGTNTIVELGSSPAQTIPTTLSQRLFTVSVAATNPPFPVYFVVRLKTDAVTGTPTIRLYSEGDYDSHFSFPYIAGSGVSGLTDLNGLTASAQTFAVGTTGTDFGISSAVSTHTFNLPTAAATVRGALSSNDWTTFNSKQAGNANLTTLASAGVNGTAGGFMRSDATNATLTSPRITNASVHATTLLVSGTAAGALDLYQTNGANYVRLLVPDSFPAANYNFYVPTNTGAANDVLTRVGDHTRWASADRGTYNIGSLFLTNGMFGPINTNTWTNTLTINLSNGWTQVVPLAGDTTLAVSSQTAGVAVQTTVFLIGTNAASVITIPAAWQTYGTNDTNFTVPANKEAFVQFLSIGTNATDVRIAYDVAQ